MAHEIEIEPKPAQVLAFTIVEPNTISQLAGGVIDLRKEWHHAIVRRANIMGGKPIIEGTRIRVSDIVGYRKMGYSKPKIRRALPHLTLAQIQSALDYYAHNRPEIDQEIAEEEQLVASAPRHAGTGP